MLEAEASKQFLGRQVFWLTADNGFRTAFPRAALFWRLAVALNARRPRRSQRRPRNGIAPFSLLPPPSRRSTADLSKLTAYNYTLASGSQPPKSCARYNYRGRNLRGRQRASSGLNQEVRLSVFRKAESDKVLKTESRPRRRGLVCGRERGVMHKKTTQCNLLISQRVSSNMAARASLGACLFQPRWCRRRRLLMADRDTRGSD
jgi:hypothetical protein